MRRYGTDPPARLRRVTRCRRDALEAFAAAAVSSLPLRSGLRLVEGLLDAAVRGIRGLLHGELAGEDLGEHRLEDVAVLDVHPVLRLRHEPAARSGPLVDAVSEQVGRVRDVALLLERLLARVAREVGEP